jgi:SAM-dependent methyltransferase
LDFEEAVEKAPPGWRHFTEKDIARLPLRVREHELARVPDGAHGERLVRGMFWTLVYHLEPARWDELARFEPIHPDLIEALPRDVGTAVDVGAGSGRLTAHLVKRSRRTVAVEPSAGLRALLERRLPQVEAIEGWAEDLPLEGGWSELTAACGALGPDPAVLAELRRVTARGGSVALLSPEHPEWFEANGWRRITFPPIPAPEHPRRLDDFFGPLDPPHEMVILEL